VARFVDYHPAPIRHIATHGPYTIVLKDDSSIWVYSGMTLLHTIPGAAELHHRVVCMPEDGGFVVSGMSGRVCFYTLLSLDPALTQSISASGVCSMAIDNTRRYAFACGNGTVALYRHKKKGRLGKDRLKEV
jgi:hypothetical protein